MQKQISTLGALRQRVLDRKLLLSDEVISIKSLQMDPAQPGRMIVRRGAIKEEAFEFDDRVYSQASSVLYGLPGGYIEKLLESEKGDPALAALNFNHWVGVNDDKEALLRFRKDKDGNRVIRAMKPASWNPVPYEDTLATLITKFGPDKTVEVERFDEEMLVVDMITRKLDVKITPGLHDIGKRDDPFEWGVRLRDSDAGKGDIQVMPYTKRLICSNGATTTTKGVIINISHSGKDSTSPGRIQSHIRQGLEVVDGYSARVIEMIGAAQSQMLDLDPEEDDTPTNAIMRVRRECVTSRLQEKYVREGWKIEGETIPEPSVYRLYNAVTRAGTHAEELDHDAKLHLQGVGGRILEMAQQGVSWN